MCPQKLLWRLLHQQQQLNMQLLTHLVQLQAPMTRFRPQAQVALFVLSEKHVTKVCHKSREQSYSDQGLCDA